MSKTVTTSCLFRQADNNEVNYTQRKSKIQKKKNKKFAGSSSTVATVSINRRRKLALSLATEKRSTMRANLCDQYTNTANTTVTGSCPDHHHLQPASLPAAPYRNTAGFYGQSSYWFHDDQHEACLILSMPLDDGV